MTPEQKAILDRYCVEETDEHGLIALLHTDDSSREYVGYICVQPHLGEIVLDGTFSLDLVEAICAWLREHLPRKNRYYGPGHEL